ncbi:type II secretion system protein GspG [Comamonas sp. JC664]|uniref:type II secretion system protein GspG n=1 Tax=Comamonas sp. JC664 TaxID=2801917 RepID=UPI0017495B06|nr:type II secretion system protein GspG [Comamonas sp. JC664]MBL0693850.1 type II secretion system protein GspG [Comamonas sp. JC664]GHG74748.1 type II secretion system protein GspG [Comamonas sp. KCTC 72670]
MNEHDANASPTPPTTEGTNRRQRLGRFLLAAVFLVATGLAFTLVYATEDRTLDSAQRRARADIRKLEGMFKSHHRLMGRFPTKEEGFNLLIDARLLDRVPEDPWGHPYVYWMNGDKGAVVSYGADGKPGGSGLDADLSSGGVLAAGWDQP